MPFGEKPDQDDLPVDFNMVYQEIIKPAVTATGVECVRSDEIEGAGSIHKEMFERICYADIAVVDISILNPNVFYELGVRHALNPFSTVIIGDQKTIENIPFNIHGQRIISYNYQNKSSYETTRKEITSYIGEGLKTGKNDSPVFENIPKLKVSKGKEPIKELKTIRYRLKQSLLGNVLSLKGKKVVGIKAGTIRNVKGVDVWVNTESVHMQMARFYDKRLSGIIRYRGAEKNEEGQIIKDTIAEALYGKMDGSVVETGTILVTTAGKLSETNDVERIFHIATTMGKAIGEGYTDVPEATRTSCITNALEKMDHTEDFKSNSILFPLIGASNEDERLEDVVKTLCETATNYFVNNSNSSVNEIYFLARTKAEKDACVRALEAIDRLRRLET